jgi:hypothetical protein
MAAETIERELLARTLTQIEDDLPWGLHDAYLESLTLDWPAARLDLVVRLMMTERQDRDQRARITVRGLVYCVIDPPASTGALDPSSEGLWIDAGAGVAANAAVAARLPSTPEGCFVHWLFVHDWNAFVHLCARDAELAWLEPEPVASRAETRALFPGDTIPTPKPH